MMEKSGKYRKRKHHRGSILQAEDGTCYLCVKLEGDYRQQQGLQTHHIYGGPNRGVSEAEGFKVRLCLRHHTAGAAAVHNNHANMRLLQQDAQRAYERMHTREEFMRLIGRNFLEDG